MQKYVFLALLVGCVAFVQSEGEVPECPPKNGLYPIPGNCKAYLACFNGVGRVRKCPEGLLYDSTKLCSYPDEEPDCGFPTPEQKKLNDICEDYYGYYPYPGDCHSYVLCNEGRGTLNHCPDNTVYVPYTGCTEYYDEKLCS